MKISSPMINVCINCVFLIQPAYLYDVPRPWPSGRKLKRYILFPRLAFSTPGKSTGMKHTLLPDGHPPTVAFTVFFCMAVWPEG